MIISKYHFEWQNNRLEFILSNDEKASKKFT